MHRMIQVMLEKHNMAGGLLQVLGGVKGRAMRSSGGALGPYQHFC